MLLTRLLEKLKRNSDSKNSDKPKNPKSLKRSFQFKANHSLTTIMESH